MTDRRHRDGDPSMNERLQPNTRRLSYLVLALMVAQSLLGMLFPQLYRDESFALNAWRLNDPLTLFLAVPLLGVSLRRAQRGSARAVLVCLGVLQYSLYNYAFYLFGATINVFFPLYVALFSLSAFALIAGLSNVDVRSIQMKPHTAYRRVAGYLAFWAGILAIAWTGQWAGFIFADRVPEIGEGPFRLIAALDLSLVVFPLAFITPWLWRGRTWGVVLAIVMLVKGVLYATLLSAASLPLFGRGWGEDPLLPLWLVLLAGAAVSLWSLLASVSEDEPTRQTQETGSAA